MRGNSTGGGEQINRQPGPARGIKILTGGRGGGWVTDCRRGGRSSTTIFVTRWAVWEHQNLDWRRGGRSSTTIFVTRGEERAREEQIRTRLEVPLTC